MKLLTSEEMRAVEKATINEYGISGSVLMENAGLCVIREIERLADSMVGERIHVFCGKGNNGGDGFVVARHLLNRRARVKVFLLAPRSEIKGDAKLNLEIFLRMGGDIVEVQSPRDADKLELTLGFADLVVDAILGTGAAGTISGLMLRVIELINGSEKPVISLDLPSGVSADSGQVLGGAIRSSLTITFGSPKVGLYLTPGSEYVGRIVVADISIPGKLFENPGLQVGLIEPELVRRHIPERNADSHKGTYGRVLVVAGSRGMTGAAILAGQAVLRAGAGLVAIGIPFDVQSTIAAGLFEAITIGLPGTETGSVAEGTVGILSHDLATYDALLIGPGMGLHVQTQEVIRNLVLESTIPIILDADGLMAFREEKDILALLQSPLIITPHPGELARLCAVSVKDIQEHRLQFARESARLWRVVTVLKGRNTIVAAPDGRVFINPTGNSGMATAGSGDVLSGVIAALVARGAEPFEAATAGVYLHGLAGDLAVDQGSESGLVAGDLPLWLPKAFTQTGVR